MSPILTKNLASDSLDLCLGSLAIEATWLLTNSCVSLRHCLGSLSKSSTVLDRRSAIRVLSPSSAIPIKSSSILSLNGARTRFA